MARFEDVAERAGLSFRWSHGGKSPLTNLETFGCGCAFLDANEDGWLDVILVGEPRCGLFINRGDGTFTDTSVTSGLGSVEGLWKGVAVGDYDADGHQDVFLSGYNDLRLLKGNGKGGFNDVTPSSGLRPGGWGSSAGFMDLDGDQDLDLVVGYYVITNDRTPKYCDLGNGLKTACPPGRYSAQFARLCRNNGNGTFTDVSDSAGMGQTHGKALVLAFTDYDEDGRQDFYLGNDGTPAELMHNLGNLRFDDAGVERGVALGVFGQAQAAMGADWGDYDRDGRLDLVVTAFSDEPYSLYRDVGAYYENVSTRVGVAEPTRKPLGFGTKFLDLENDGWLDIVFANGHVYDAVARVDPASSYRQKVQLFANRQGQRFEEVGHLAGPDFSRDILGRGLATGDYDNDGRVDVLVVDYEGTPLLLRNVTSAGGHWLQLELQARGKNRFAYGARITVHASGAKWVQELSPASSYLSSSSPVLHFGLGTVDRIERIEIRWPDGQVERMACDRVDFRGRVAQGERRVR